MKGGGEDVNREVLCEQRSDAEGPGNGVLLRRIGGEQAVAKGLITAHTLQNVSCVISARSLQVK